MKRYFILTKAMFLMQLRNRTTLFWNLAFPIFILIIYRLIFGEGDVDGVNYMTWVLPGVIVFNILAYGLIGSSTSMVEMREKGILRRLHASPVPSELLVGSYVTVNVIICLVQSILIVAFSMLAFQTPVTTISASYAFPMVVAGVLTCVAMGSMVSAVVSTAGASVAIGQILNFSQMFIADLVIPLQILPEGIQKAAPFTPGYAIVQLVRPALLEGAYSPEVWRHLLVILIYCLACGLVAALFFRWDPKT